MTFACISASVRTATTPHGFSVYLRETFANTAAQRISQMETFSPDEQAKAAIYAAALAATNCDCAVEDMKG
ncbi:hypothetical protein [uncultured Ruegeria sp.]|uniref:hypothetical protein n=1 Tax=uncultured Ruegeria sp. TaxID=259304 RepID=UPI0026172626|nr:hypothetical protein [uncultured Ruegeria sp.]